MPSSDPPSPYRVPASLRDLVIIDLLELTGSTTATAALLAMSQPSVSRRYQKLVRDLGLRRQNDAPVGLALDRLAEKRGEPPPTGQWGAPRGQRQDRKLELLLERTQPLTSP